MTDAPDPRLHPYRADLAAASLRSHVAASGYVDPEPGWVTAATIGLSSTPDQRAPFGSELIYGEAVRIFDRHGGWAWVQAVVDDYVGYVPETALTPADEILPPATHKVAGRAAYLFGEAGMKRPPLAVVPMDALLRLHPDGPEEGENGYFRLIDETYIHRSGLTPVEFVETDPASVAERLLGAPYLWGGRSSLGLDCSGLVQTCLARCGIAVLRDTDMQEHSIGTPIATDGPFRRNDILFFPGHVGIMVDEERLIHANATHMAVAVEPLDIVAERSRVADGRGLTSARRVGHTAG